MFLDWTGVFVAAGKAQRYHDSKTLAAILEIRRNCSHNFISNHCGQQ